MLRVVRRGDRHDARDLTVSIRFEGEFATAFLEGRADGIIPGEILKSLVHQIVREHAGGELEVIGLGLCRRVLTTHRQVSRVRVEIAEQPWSRMDVGGKPQGQTFVLGGPEQRTVTITSNGAADRGRRGHRQSHLDADLRLPSAPRRSAPRRWA